LDTQIGGVPKLSPLANCRRQHPLAHRRSVLALSLEKLVMAKVNLSNWLSFRTMKVWQKCFLIGAPFLIPIAVLTYFVFANNNEVISVAKTEMRGTDVLRAIKKLTLQLAQHRGRTNAILNGDSSQIAERNKVTTEVDATLTELEAIDVAQRNEFKTSDRLASIKSTWSDLKKSVPSFQKANVKESFARHTDLITLVLEFANDVAEYSTLALDPQTDTYYLQNIMFGILLQEAEYLGQARGFGAGVVTKAMTSGGQIKDTMTVDERVQLAYYLNQIDQLRLLAERQFKSAAKFNPKLETRLVDAFEEHKAAANTFANYLRIEVLNADTLRITATQFFDAGTAATNAAYKLFDKADPILVELLDARVSTYRKTNWISAIGIFGGLAVVLFIATRVVRTITTQVNNLTTLFDRIEIGDYQTRATVLSEDELGNMTGAINNTLDRTLTLIQSSDEKEQIQRSIMKLLEDVSGMGDGDLRKDAEVSADMTGAIADSFNFMLEQLRKIIGNVQSATLQVSTSANEIYTSAEHLAGGSENQAEQIVNTSAAIDEMAVSIQQVSENAATSTNVAQQALNTAKQGNAAVKNTIEGMGRIREQAQETSKRIKRLGETSQEIGQIVQLIDDIADRTSILALNASIQAAAAGDAGRGFAVVAEEVERLAVRSTEATKKIAALVKAIQGETNEAVAAMEKNIQEVVSGSKVANQAGQSLVEIESVSLKLSELIQSISLASKQQARGSEALAKSMGDISQITQQTAAGTKQTAESVNNLAKLADELRDSVTAFKLPTGYGSKT
jgi:twitching motility protein PilJ